MSLCPFSRHLLTGIEVAHRKLMQVLPVLPLLANQASVHPFVPNSKSTDMASSQLTYDLLWNKRLTKVFTCTGSNAFFWSEQKIPKRR